MMSKKLASEKEITSAAMEYMGSVNERVAGDTSDEIAYWERLGLSGLREALSIQ